MIDDEQVGIKVYSFGALCVCHNKICRCIHQIRANSRNTLLDMWFETFNLFIKLPIFFSSDSLSHALSLTSTRLSITSGAIFGDSLICPLFQSKCKQLQRHPIKWIQTAFVSFSFLGGFSAIFSWSQMMSDVRLSIDVVFGIRVGDSAY